MESRIMDKILEGGDAKEAAKDELKEQPDLLAKWLDGVTTLSGEDGLAAVKAAIGI
jgi:glycine betaine/proline transport system substrate-binding protein